MLTIILEWKLRKKLILLNKPFIIGVAGESGVGKTTIAKIIGTFYKLHGLDSINLSTDDLHKWERTNTNWKIKTHLDPDSNNLELGDIQLQDLANSKFIYRSIYNHETGNFNPPIKIESQQIIIVEGLHAFFTETSKKLIDSKIFVDTDENLRTHWKIIRDTEMRGYKYNEVLDIINKRKIDNIKIRDTQIKIADVIIKISTKNEIKIIGAKSEKIDLVFTIEQSNDINNELLLFIKDYS